MATVDTLDVVKSLVTEYGGESKQSINWIWASFPDEALARECFDRVAQLPDVVTRGFHPANPNDSNENFHQASFRYRPRTWGE